MNETGLQRCDDLDKPLDGKVKLGLLGQERMEGFGDELTGKFGEGQRARPRGEDEDITRVQPLSPVVFVQMRVAIDGQLVTSAVVNMDNSR